MLKNEVASDGAAPTIEHKSQVGGLIGEFTDALSDPKTLAIIGGAALATAAAVKFGRPLLELGKTATPVGDDAVLTAIRNASSARHGETSVLAVARGSRIEPATDALVANSIPIKSGLGAAESPFMAPATDAIIANAKPIVAKDIGPLKIDPLVAIDHAGYGGVAPNIMERMKALQAYGPSKFDPYIPIDHAGYSALSGRLAPPLKSADVEFVLAHEVPHQGALSRGIQIPTGLTGETLQRHQRLATAMETAARDAKAWLASLPPAKVPKA